MDVVGADLIERVESWSRRPSDHLMSEHSRLAVIDGSARIYQSQEDDVVVTVAPTSIEYVGLVEVAARLSSSGSAFWNSIRSDLVAQASSDGYRKLEVIDRGSTLDFPDEEEGRATVRMVMRNPDPDQCPATNHFSAEDEDRILEILNDAFADHPENGGWKLSDLRRRTNASGFDPMCFQVRRDGGSISGFCWTKVHPDNVGEIYLIAVSAEARRQGLGRELLREGIWHLVDAHGSDEVLVYSDAKNVAAVNLYHREGFVTDRVDRRFDIYL